jgi:hypothetical protein
MILTLRLVATCRSPFRSRQPVKELAALLSADAPTVKLRLDGIAFPSGRDLSRFCDDSGEDFDRVDWKQD